MRWYVDINSIGSSAPTQRYCLEAEQWQKALMSVRDKRGDDAPFGNFSIELLDEGYRAIDPTTRTRYVVTRAPDDAALTNEPLLITTTKPTSGKTPEPRASRPRASSRGRVRGKSPSIPDDPVPAKASTESQAAAKPSPAAAPVAAPPEPASKPPAAAESVPSPSSAAEPAKPAPPREPPTAQPSSAPHAPEVFTAATVKTPAPSAQPQSQPQAPSQPPLVAPRPMQAETAFERMTGGAAVPLPDSVSPTADVPTEVLPSFTVLTKRSEDPTPSSPLTYREMALAVAPATSLKEAEAIARAQFEILRNALSGAPKGKFIQLAVFDHEFSARPKHPPVVTLAYRDWRNAEPELRFPLRDGPSPSMPPPASAQSAEPAPQVVAPAPASAPAPAPPSVPAPAAPSVPTPAAPSVPTPAAPSAPAPAPASAPPPAAPAASAPAAAPSSPDMFSDKTAVTSLEAVQSPPPEPEPEPVFEPIRPAPVISIGDDSAGPAPDLPAPPVEVAAAPVAAASPPAAPQPAELPEEDIAVEPSAPVPAAAAVPVPTPSEIRRSAADMAGDDERTWVKPSTPPPQPEPAPAARPASVPPPPAARPASVPPPPPQRRPGSVPPPNGTQPMMQIPPPAHLSAPPPEPRPASIPPAASVPPAVSLPPSASAPPPASLRPPVSVAPGPKPQGTGVTVKTTSPPRKAGDDLLTDLFEATADLSFVRDVLEGAEFVQDLVYESIPSALVLISFFDINTREFVVVRQACAPREGDPLGSAVLKRASEFSGAIAQTMRSGRTTLLNGNAAAALAADARWQSTGLSPHSVAITPVAAGGRYLGLVEVADPLDGSPFTEGDGHALKYIGEQLAEFLAQRELVLDEASVLKPKLAQLARRA